MEEIPEAGKTKEDFSYSDTIDKETLKDKLKYQEEQLNQQLAQ